MIQGERASGHFDQITVTVAFPSESVPYLVTMLRLLLLLAVVAAAAGDFDAAHNDDNYADLLTSTTRGLQRLEQELSEQRQQRQRQRELWEEAKQQWLREKRRREGEMQERERLKQHVLSVFQSLNDRVNSLKNTSSLTKRVPENAELSREARKLKRHDWHKEMKKLEHDVDKMAKRVRDTERKTMERLTSFNLTLDAHATTLEDIQSREDITVQEVFVVNALLQGLGGQVNTLEQSSATLAEGLNNVTSDASSNTQDVSQTAAHLRALDKRSREELRARQASTALAGWTLNRKTDLRIQTLRSAMYEEEAEVSGNVQTLRQQTQALNQTVVEKVQDIHNDMGFMVQKLFTLYAMVDDLGNETSTALEALDSKMRSQSETLDNVMSEVISGLVTAGINIQVARVLTLED